MASVDHFHWADYLIFTTSLVISAGISIYYAISGWKKSSTTDYLLGGRNMGVLPVSASLVVSLVSAISILGLPVETYGFGIYTCLRSLGFTAALATACLFYLPVFHRLQLTSVNEYLERRYSKKVRYICSVITMIQMLLLSSVALYAPSIVINQATALPYWGGVVLSALLCTFYTSLGGFKTVLWTDTLQCIVILVGLAVTLFKGTADVGGLARVFNVSSIGGRTNIENLTPGLTQRYDAWTWLFGTYPTLTAIYATSQFSVQRFCSIRTMNKARAAVLLTVIMHLLIVLLTSGLGLLAFTYYFDCDPLLSGRIRTRDQTVPLLVMDVFQGIPGISGVFVSSIFSAALSTVSSVQNSFVALMLEDIIKPIKKKVNGKPLEERLGTNISRCLVFVVGVVQGCLALTVATTGKMIMQMAYAAMTLGVAPALGVFSLGLFCPFVNTAGAVSGLCSGLAVLGWLVVGTMTVPKTLQPMLPVSANSCLNTMTWNATTITSDGFINQSSIPTVIYETTPPTSTHVLLYFYSITHEYYVLVGVIPTILVGVIVSALTGGLKTRKMVDKEALFSFQKHGLQCSKDQRNPEDDASINAPTSDFIDGDRELNSFLA